MAHSSPYKKAKEFSEDDLDHPESFTNISSHNKLVRYRDEGKARKGEDFNPSEGPIDPELVMIAGNGSPMARSPLEMDLSIVLALSRRSRRASRAPLLR